MFRWWGLALVHVTTYPTPLSLLVLLALRRKLIKVIAIMLTCILSESKLVGLFFVSEIPLNMVCWRSEHPNRLSLVDYILRVAECGSDQSQIYIIIGVHENLQQPSLQSWNQKFQPLLVKLLNQSQYSISVRSLVYIFFWVKILATRNLDVTANVNYFWPFSLKRYFKRLGRVRSALRSEVDLTHS